MHPAPSVIFFTTFSGLGFGLLFWLGLGQPAPTGAIAFLWWGLGYCLAVGGLLAATFHLANPRNAVKAFSQWRSSWLSREGICAVAALGLLALPALLAVFGDGGGRLFGWLGALFSVITVFTTAMIYTQLRSVPRWNQMATPPLFLTLSLGGGALLAGLPHAALTLLIVAAVAQVANWWIGDKRFAQAGSTMETATGLGFMGQVRQFEGPHTGTNYLLTEMVHVVGRKHAAKLRMISFVCAYLAPIALLIALGGDSVALAFAALFHVCGVLASRWLFFAEAEHVVGLYYGKRGATAQAA